jgi:TRAP-type C4-dicarboxylate transport system permease small subunit
MKQFLRGRAALFSACFALVALGALAMSSMASAAITFDAKDFTEPIETQIGTAAPIVIGFIAAVFGLTFLIRWAQRRANSAK